MYRHFRDEDVETEEEAEERASDMLQMQAGMDKTILGMIAVQAIAIILYLIDSVASLQNWTTPSSCRALHSFVLGKVSTDGVSVGHR